MRISLHRLALSAIAAVTICLAPHMQAQQHLNVPREDGRTTPLLLYPAVGVAGCAPLAVISHGAGGSEDGYRYLARAMANLGYTTVVMGHRESGLAALRADIRQYGMMAGVRALVADPNAEQDRLLDVTATLKWHDAHCPSSTFRILLGHSMGAETVMLEAGARNMIGVNNPPAGQNRFDAYIALSPEGSGVVFPEQAWSGIHQPMLILTGTRDQSLQGGPQARLQPWNNLPGNPSHCQWMGVIDNATHMNFAGNGFGHETVEPLVTQTIADFLTGVRHSACTALPAARRMTLRAK